MASNKTLNTLLAGAVAVTIAGAATPANADSHESKEKCYGVVKAGHNDCANAAKTHSCAGYSKVDGDPGEWIALPAGLCDKLVGGSTEPMMKKDMDHDHGDDHGHDH